MRVEPFGEPAVDRSEKIASLIPLADRKDYLTDKQDTMLYIFSGPDFLYATSFLPNASTYVLAGLEPVGVIPDLTRLSPWVINGELRNLEISMGSLFNYSFFITQK